MKKFLSFLFAALLSFPAHAELEKLGAAGGGGSVSYPISIANGGTGQTTAPGALGAVTSGMMIDPRDYGAVCGGATWSGGIPSPVNSGENDTAGFEAAEFAAATSGGVVMVPDGCWVANLQMLSGVTLVGQNWAPNYGYDYGTGAIGTTLSLTPGSGYTNGTYPITSLNNAGSGTGFLTGANGGDYNYAMSSTTSMTIDTGSQTFTASTTGGAAQFAVNQWITVADTGTPSNFMFGQVTSVSGTSPSISVTVNVTITGGSGTIDTWSVYIPPIVTVSGGALSSYYVNSYAPGAGYPADVSINIPTGAGSGSGGAITSFVRPVGDPLAHPVMYVTGSPAYAINWNSAETIGFVGFEINANGAGNAFGVNCEGGTTSIAGFGGKIWNYQMSFKGCQYGIYDSSCYDYLVSENSDYGANTYGIGGCFSDFLSQGDTFASGTYGIAGSGGGFARISNDRFEYLTEGIAPGANAFLEISIVNSQFDHFDKCAIDLGTQWNNVTMTGGALKAGGVDGSLTVTGTADSANSEVELTVNSAVGSIHGGETVTAPFNTVASSLTTSITSQTIGTGAQTFTTVASLGLPSAISSTTGTQSAGSTTWTDSSKTFSTGYVGSVLNISSCTGTGCKTGQYEIIAYTSTHVVVLNRTATDGVHNITAATYTAARPLLIYDTSSKANWEYGTVTSDTTTSLVMDILATNGSGTIATWTIGTPYWVYVNYVGGTTEANGLWPLGVIDSGHIELEGTTYANAYTSGGYGGVQGMDADICMEGNTSTNGGLTLSNVGYYSSSSLGQAAAPAYVWEMSTTGADNDYVGIWGSTLLQAVQSGVTINYNAYTLGVENPLISSPPHYYREAMGVPTINTYNTNFIQLANGQIGMGASPLPNTSLDLSANTNGALNMPEWTTTGRPAVTGGFGYNTTTGQFEGYNGSAWAPLFVWPSAGDVVISGGTSAPTGLAPVNGDCLIGIGGVAAWGSCTGTTDTNALYRNISFTFDGGGNALTSGKIIYLSNIPYGGTITAATMIADQSCSATVDIWETTSGSVPTIANTITDNDLVTLSSQQQATTSVSAWTTSITAGNVMAAKLTTTATCQFINVGLQVTAN